VRGVRREEQPRPPRMSRRASAACPPRNGDRRTYITNAGVKGMAKTAPDWTRTGTVAGYAEYLRKSSDAICVLVIRPHDSVFAVDPDCKPEDAEELVKQYVSRLASAVDFARSQKKKAGRLELGPCPE
jgi:hypothetical protein